MKKRRISDNWRFFEGKSKEYKIVDLPHDYAITSERSADAPGGGSVGFYNGGSGKYVKYIKLGEAAHTILDIDGAYMCSRIILNDDMLAVHPHGYTPFLVDLTEKIRKNHINRIRIDTENVQPSSRWYSGAGLYRDVFLWTGGRVYIKPWDLFVSTDKISDNNADVSVKINISSDIEAGVKIVLSVMNESGIVTKKSVNLSVNIGETPVETVISIPNPSLWDTENPNLYTLSAEIVLGEAIEDAAETKFGIRVVTADTKNGLMINGRPIKLRGGCIHHDHGALGAASFPKAEERKISLLKKAGFNAVRIAHNPPSLALLEVCDRLGMIVMDEAFDMWNLRKSPQDYSLWFGDWWARDISYMVLRDRNHPCVISYSIGNEIVERDGRSNGYEWSRKLADEVRKYDTTRFVTAGICGMWGWTNDTCDEKDVPEEYQKDIQESFDDPGEGAPGTSWGRRTEKYIEPLDIAGYNYMYDRYENDKTEYPNRVIWGSETTVLNFYRSWMAVMKNSNAIGDFTWTAYDNIGEAGAGRFIWENDGKCNGISECEYPWRTCYQGDLDLCGYRRPQSYFREAIWNETSEAKIFTTHPKHYGEGFSGTGWHWHDVHECWTFEDKYIGKPVKTEVYTCADRVEFFLNGKSVGSSVPVEGIAYLDIVYEKGELTAKAYKDGKIVGTSSLRTVGEPVKISVIAESDTLLADNRDLCYFDITIEDDNGDRVTDAENEMKCEASGGELLGFFGANPANEDVYTSGKCHAFDGRAVAIVRTRDKGEVKLSVYSEGLKEADAFVNAK